MTNFKNDHQPSTSITTVVSNGSRANNAGSLKEFMDWFKPEPVDLTNLEMRLSDEFGGTWQIPVTKENSGYIHVHGVHRCWEVSLDWVNDWTYDETICGCADQASYQEDVLRIVRMWQLDVCGKIYERENSQLLLIMLNRRTEWDWVCDDTDDLTLVYHDDYGNLNGRLCRDEVCWVYQEEADGDHHQRDPGGFKERRALVYEIVGDWTAGVFRTESGIDDYDWRLALDDFDHEDSQMLIEDLRSYFGGFWSCKSAGPNIILTSCEDHGQPYKHTLLYDGDEWQYKENQSDYDLDPEMEYWRSRIAIDLAESMSCRLAKANQQVSPTYSNKHLALLIDMLNMKFGGDWKLQNQWSDLQIHTFRDELRRKLVEEDDGTFRYIDQALGKASHLNSEKVFKLIGIWRERCKLTRRAKMVERAEKLDDEIGGDWRIVVDSDSDGYMFKDLGPDSLERIIRQDYDGQWIYVEPLGGGTDYEEREEQVMNVIRGWGKDNDNDSNSDEHAVGCDGLPECNHPKGIKVLRAYMHRPECSVGDVVGVCKVCGETQCIRDVLLDGVEFEDHVSVFEAIHVRGDEPTTHEGHPTKTYLEDERMRQLIDSRPEFGIINKCLIVSHQGYYWEDAEYIRLKILGVEWNHARGIRYRAHDDEDQRDFISEWAPEIEVQKYGHNLERWHREWGKNEHYFDIVSGDNDLYPSTNPQPDLLNHCDKHKRYYYTEKGVGPYHCPHCPAQDG